MGLYYQCSENKDTDQLRGYREADLRLCFRLFAYAKSRFSLNEAHFSLNFLKYEFKDITKQK